MLRALRYRNYRLFFLGQGVSLVGTWLTRIATAWLVYRLVPEDQPDRAAWLLGVLGFVSLAPVFALTPFTGVLVDRWDQHRIIVWTQILSSLQILALTILTIGGWITIWHIMLLQLAQGIINAFDAPARQAFVVQMVENRADLPNAIALNSSLFNGARLIGPAIGGFLIWSVGEGWCFALDTVSYIAVIGAFLMMRVPEHVRPPDVKHVWQELRDGVSYIMRFAPMRILLLVVGMMSLMAMSIQTLMPAFADALADTRAHAPRALGFLMGAVGFGALGGAMFLAARHAVLGLERAMALSAGLLGASMVGFAFQPPLWVSVLLAAVSGFGMITTLASGNTLIQTLVDDRMRGRVMSFYTMAVMGMAPFGSLLAGALAGRWGKGASVALTGACCVVVAGLFALHLRRLRQLVRPIYVEKGVIPQVGTALRSASTYSTPVKV